MQTVTWLAFVAHNALSRTVVHFFPFSGAVSAPYTTECRLTIFGGGLPTRSVSLDGARLGQPDGLRIEDAFPEISVHGDGRLVGLQIDLEAVQQRVDLSASGCVIELARPNGAFGPATRFRPSRVAPPDERGGAMAPIVGLKDGFQTTSLVVVNRTGESFAPTVRMRPASAQPWDGGVQLGAVPGVPSVDGESVVEIEFDESVWSEGTTQECGWGVCTSRAIDVAPPPLGVALYAVYRDPQQRRPISVSALGER